MSAKPKPSKKNIQLSPRGMDAQLAHLDGWSISRGSLVREITFSSATNAANRVGVFCKHAARMNHPIDLRMSGAKVIVRLPPAEGELLSRGDFKFAKVITGKSAEKASPRIVHAEG